MPKISKIFLISVIPILYLLIFSSKVYAGCPIVRPQINVADSDLYRIAWTISWTDNNSGEYNEDGFRIERGCNCRGGGGRNCLSEIVSVGRDITFYEEDHADYYCDSVSFRVCAVKSGCSDLCSNWSNFSLKNAPCFLLDTDKDNVVDEDDFELFKACYFCSPSSCSLGWDKCKVFDCAPDGYIDLRDFVTCMRPCYTTSFCECGEFRSTPSEPCPTSLPISDDSYTDVENPNTNYGGSDVIRTQKWSAMVAKKGFIKFDLSTISSAEVVDKAKLRLWVDGWGGTGGEIGIYRVTGDWNEGGITWNNSPSVDGNVWASTSVGNLGYWEWDITQLVKYWLANPGSNKGLMVQANTSNTSWYISSSENSEENARPCLKIDYTSAPTLTPTPTSSPTPTPPPTPISGVVFIDRDKDGKKDADEGCFEGEVNFYSDLGRLGSFTSHASCNSYLFYVPSGATQIYIYPPPEGYMFSSWTMTDSEGNICFGSGGSCFYSTGCR